MMTISAAEMQKNFGKYLQAVQDGDEIVILKNGKEVRAFAKSFCQKML